MNMRWGCCCVACLLAAPAGAADRVPPTVIENCLGGDAVSFRRGETGIVLDELDRYLVTREILARYPVIERHGHAPQAIAMWRRKQGDWVYATLSKSAGAAQGRCYTATVSVNGMASAPALLKKYFGIVAPPG